MQGLRGGAAAALEGSSPRGWVGIWEEGCGLSDERACCVGLDAGQARSQCASLACALASLISFSSAWASQVPSDPPVVAKASLFPQIPLSYHFLVGMLQPPSAPDHLLPHAPTHPNTHPFPSWVSINILIGQGHGWGRPRTRWPVGRQAGKFLPQPLC